MADIGRILYLPPAAAISRPNTIQPGTIQQGTIQQGANQAASADDASDAQSARAKQFRFRVYDGGRFDGGRPDEPLAGDNGLPARRTDEALADDAAADRLAGSRAQARAGGEQAGGEAGGERAGQRRAGFGTPSAPFLAQLIAQEQLRPGLYDPPLRAADRAYRQAGGEPALQDGAATARFQIAV